MKLKLILLIILCLIFCQFINGQSLNFNSPIVFDAGYNSHMIVLADFNNDGMKDIATVNYSGDNVSILLAAKVDSFYSEVLYDAGNGAYDLAEGDFNNDSILDLVVSNYIDDDISVLLGIGDGTFSPKVDYVSGNGPRGIVVGQFNNDSLLDIAVSMDLEDKIAIFLGTGNGAFAPKVNYITGDRPHDMLIGLITQDTIPDLITVNRSDDNISLLAGNGDGSFQSHIDFDAGHFPQFATLGYLNNDSLLDLVVCNTWNFDSVSVLLGDNINMFGQTNNYYAGNKPYSVAIGDFNLDSTMDLVISNSEVDSLSLLLGLGDGSFQFNNNISTGDKPNGILAVDIDLDSDIDILNVNYLGGGSTHLHINSLCPAIEFISNDIIMVGGNNGSAIAIVTGGLEPYTYSWSSGINQNDSITTNLSLGIYTLTVTDSLGCFVTADIQINEPICNLEIYVSTTHISSIGGNDGQALVEPINGVPPYDILWNDPTSQTDSLAINLTKGYYEVIVTDSIGCMDSTEINIVELPCINEANYYSHSGAADIKVCYINNDTILDIVSLYSVAYSTDKINILLGTGYGNYSYHSSFTVGTGGDQPTSIVVNDFNGDSINDIIVTVPDGVNGISVYLGNGDATFQSGTNIFIGSRPWDLVSHDFDFDGDNDLLICREQGDDVRMLLNNGNAGFSSIGSKSVGWNPQDIKAGYLNADTLIDLVVVNKLQANISVILGSPGYYFSSATSYLAGLSPIEATLDDFNNDSIIDIAVTGSTSNMVYIYIGNGDGTFQDKVEYQTGNGTSGISSLDMNNDSIIDLAVSITSDNTLQILLGIGDGVFDSAMNYPLYAASRKTIVADIDNDGDTELIVAYPSEDSITILDNCFYYECMHLTIDSIHTAEPGNNNGYASISVFGKYPPYTFQWNDTLQQTSAYADSLFAGYYTVLVTDSLGCVDSLNVIIEQFPCYADTSVVQIGAQLQSNATLSSFQWLNCDNAYAEISGATDQIFIGDNYGNYAVEITQNSCIDTSDCYYILITEIIENKFEDEFKVYPNPSSGKFTVELGSLVQDVSMTIMDISGRQICSKSFSNINSFDYTLNGKPGVYLMIIVSKHKNAVVRLMLE